MELYTKTINLIKNIDDRATLQVLNTKLRISQNHPICVAEEKQPTLKKTTQNQSRIVTISSFRIKYTRIGQRKILKI